MYIKGNKHIMIEHISQETKEERQMDTERCIDKKGGGGETKTMSRRCWRIDGSFV